MAAKGQTIDTIRVGLGLDTSSLNQDIQKELAGFTIQPSLVRPEFSSLKTFVKDINETMSKSGNRNVLGVKAQVSFSETQAKGALKTVLEAVESSGLSVKVPIEFVYPQGGGGAPPNAGGGGGAPPPTGGRGGPGRQGGGGPQAAPAAPAAAGPATGTATGTGLATAAVVTMAASNAAARTRPAAGGAAAAAPAAGSRRGRAAAAAPAEASQTEFQQYVNAGIAAVMPGVMQQIQTQQAAQAAPIAAAPGTPGSIGRRPQRSSFQEVFTPRDADIRGESPEFRQRVKTMRGMMRRPDFSPQLVQEAVIAARSGYGLTGHLNPLSQHAADLAPYQPFYEHAKELYARGQEHRVAVRNARAQGPMDDARKARAQALNTAISSGDWATLDTMYPGVGELFAQGRPKEAEAAYFAAKYKDPKNWEKPHSYAQEMLGTRRGQMRKRWDYMAQIQPEDFALLSWTGSGLQWEAGEEAPGGLEPTWDETGTLSWAPAPAGSGGWASYAPTSKVRDRLSAAAGGAAPAPPVISRQRRFELMASDPEALIVELNTLKEQARLAPLAPDEEEHRIKLEKAIAAQKRAKGRLVGGKGETPFPTSAHPLYGPVLARLRELATGNTPTGSPEALLERKVQHEEMVGLRSWLQEQDPGLFGQFMAAASSPGQQARADTLSRKIASLPEGSELPRDAALNRTVGDVAGVGRRKARTLSRIKKDEKAERDRVAMLAQDRIAALTTPMQGGGYRKGDRWWRGGSSNQDLWVPGRHVVAGETMDEPYSTLGSGLYLTDIEGARSYAHVRSTRGEAAGGLPVIDSRIVDIPEDRIWQPQGGYFDDPELLKAWQGRLKDHIREVRDDPHAWMLQGGPKLTLDYLNTVDLYRDSAMRGPMKGKPPTLHQAIGANYGVNQPLFSDFMQRQGFEGLLSQEGGESSDEGRGFLHPSLVVFDPRNKLLHRQGGGLLDRLMQARIQSLMGKGQTKESQELQKKLEDLRGGWDKKSTKGMAMGGSRPSSLSDLSGVASNISHITEVGEQGREWIVGQRDGSEFVVPNHQLPHFRQMVGMADGGEREVIGGRRQDARGRWHWVDGPNKGAFAKPPSKPLGPAGMLVYGGGEGPWPSRRSVAASRAEGTGLATPFAGVQKVAVVNWPTGLTGGALAQGPSRPSRMFAQGPDEWAAASGGRALGARPTPTSLPPEPDVAGVVPPLQGSGPLGKAQAKAAGAEAVSQLRYDLDQVGIDISEALQKSPVRALSVAFGQIAQTVVGGRAGILERAGLARAARGKAEGLVGQLESSISARDWASQELEFLAGQREVGYRRNNRGLSVLDQEAMDLLSEEDRDRFAELIDTERGQEAKREFLLPRAEQAKTEAQEAARSILTPAQQVKSQAVGLVGIVGGTITFTAAMHLAQAGLAAFANVTGKAIDAFSNWTMTMNAVSSELAESMVKSSGDIQAAAGSLVGELGLPAGTDISALIERSQRLGGAQLFQRGTDVLRAERSAEAASAGLRVRGLGTGFDNGPLAGLPFLGPLGWVGQQQGMAELTAGRLLTVPLPTAYAGPPLPSGYYQPMGVPAGTPEAGTPSYAPPRGLLALPENENWELTAPQTAYDIEKAITEGAPLTTQEIADRLMAEAQAKGGVTRPPSGSELGRAIAGIQAPVTPGYGVFPGAGGMMEWANETRKAMDMAAADEQRFGRDITEMVDGLNDTLTKVNVPDMFVHIDPKDPKNAAKIKAFEQAMKDIGAESYLPAFQERGVIAVTSEGGEIDPNRLNRIFQGLSEIVPTFEELLKTSGRAFQAQIAGIQRSAELSRETEIPTEFFSQFVSRPLAGSLRGIPWSAGIVAPSATGATAAAGARYGGMVQQTYQQMQPYLEQGREQMLALGVTEEEISSVERLGASIARLQTRASNLQLDVEQAQYNEQLYLSQRSLSDILGILGKTGTATSELGRLQRAQIADSRELARIQLARSQRELNLELAISKIRAPGETAEERAMRMREAQMLAREKQRELDLTRGSTERGFRIEDIGYQRQARDLGVQIRLMQQARRVSIDVRGIEQVIQAKEQLLGVKQQFMGVSRSVGLEVRRAGNAIIQNLESRLGLFTDKEIAKVNAWATRMVRTVNRAIDMATTGDTQPRMPAGRGSRGGPGRAIAAASGFIGMAAGPTQFLAGEAGREHVIVLRNPRTSSMSPMSGGGGGNVSINLVLNASVRGEADEERLARKVARVLHREASMMVGA
jgi:hypothetical protein